MKITPATREGYQLLHEGAQALSIVEANGMKVDTDYIERTIGETTEKIKQLEHNLSTHEVTKQWKYKYKGAYNPDSREQLGDVLFNVMGYESPGHTRNKNKIRHKTDKESLNKVDSDYVAFYLEISRLKKVRGTYLKGVLREVQDGYIHPSFNLHTAQTFRSSCDHPNFQNIPIRVPEIAKLIRQAFIARKGGQIVEIDYSGAEVCCAACYNEDPKLIQYIKDPSKDMHRDMAVQCFMLPNDYMELCDDKMGKDIRYVSKNNFVFPEFYGSTYLEVAPNLWDRIDQMNLEFQGQSLYDHLHDKGIEELGTCSSKWPAGRGTFEHHIKKVEKHFWGTRFKVYAQWKRDWHTAYQKTSSFKTLTGFEIAGVLKRNEVVNYPIQGSAFHWLLWSLIEIQKAIKKYSIRALIVGQIHDSIVSDVYHKDVSTYIQVCQDIMTEKVRKHWPWIIVPLKIDAEVAPIGKSWYDKKKYKG